MQFHLNGYAPGDPCVIDSNLPVDAPPATLPQEVDVLIVGSGPTGLTLAAQLAAFAGIRTHVVEQKPGPLQVGQADGIACRTMEMFEAFGFSDRVLRESYWVNETAFWNPDPLDSQRIRRSRIIQDVEDGLSEFPHVILNQARVHDFYLDVMRNSAARLRPSYSRRLTGLTVAPSSNHPVTATFERSEGNDPPSLETIRARFVVGCDGARSAVRKALGAELHGDSANQAWGVMDVLAVSDFPDIRRKAVIHSASEGSVLIIPREGGYLVRLYVELDKLNADERVGNRNITADRLIAAAQRILHPYSLEVREVAWWSVYEIGQRLCDRFDDLQGEDAGRRTPNVFLAGDACHTHSPKAGQGMNVSMQDAFNLGWKLAAVIEGRCAPQLLNTYSTERRGIATELIDFDRKLARLFSARPKTDAGSEGIEPAEFQDYFIQQMRFTAGTATRYPSSSIVGDSTHQRLATGFGVGTRFHSAPVVRLADGRPMQLGHVNRADGRWRIFLFGDRGTPETPAPRLLGLCEYLWTSAESVLNRHGGAGAEIDSVVEVIAVFQQHHLSLSLALMPDLLLPRKGRYRLVDYEKIYCPDIKSAQDIFDLRGIDRAQGCMVVVRPDQYIGLVLPLDGQEALAEYFGEFMVARPRVPSSSRATVAYDI